MACKDMSATIALEKNTSAVFFPSKSEIKSTLELISKLLDGMDNVYAMSLSLVGTGYRAYVPKRLGNRVLLLKLGFGKSFVKLQFACKYY